MIDYYRAAVRPPKGTKTELQPISAPTLVIWGEKDRYLGPDLAEPHHEDVPNLDRVERLPDASHWVHHDEAERVTPTAHRLLRPRPPNLTPPNVDGVRRTGLAARGMEAARSGALPSLARLAQNERLRATEARKVANEVPMAHCP